MPVYGYGAAVKTGSCLYGTCQWGHGTSQVNVNVNTYNNYNHATNVNATDLAHASGTNVAAWNHDPAHRGGVNYSNPAVAAQYRGYNASGSVSQSQARGWGSNGSATQAAQRQPAQQAPAASQWGGGDGGNALSGVGNGGFEQQASDRGAQSFGGGGFGGGGGFRGGRR
jgi:hypothetical protein